MLDSVEEKVLSYWNEWGFITSGALEELERTLALLAFEDPHQSPFSDLLSHSHRQKVFDKNNTSISYDKC